MLYPYRNICNRAKAEQSNQLFKDTEVKTLGLIWLGYEFSVDRRVPNYFWVSFTNIKVLFTFQKSYLVSGRDWREGMEWTRICFFPISELNIKQFKVFFQAG